MLMAMTPLAQPMPAVCNAPRVYRGRGETGEAAHDATVSVFPFSDSPCLCNHVVSHAPRLNLNDSLNFPGWRINLMSSRISACPSQL